MSTAANKLVEAPQDYEIEQRILGILIKHPQKMDTALDKLREYHFANPTHRTIFKALLDLYTKQGKVSYVRLYDKIRREKLLSDPEAALVALTETVVTGRELEPCIELLREGYVKRRILAATEEIEQMILREEEETTEKYQARAQEIIFAATQVENSSDEPKELLDVLSRCYTNLVERKEGKVPYGLSVRFPSIDMLTTGFKKKDLIILAGRPSMGKTSLALNFAANVAKRQIPVLIFSLEMDDEQIGDRLVLGELFRYRDRDGNFLIPSAQYATKLSEEQLKLTEKVYSELYDLPIQIVDQRGLTSLDIRAKARKIKATCPNLGLVVIDYLQLIRPAENDKYKSWALQVGDIVRELRDLAGEINVPIILLSQLNRGVESRDNKRPMMSDLRDSGNIEEFADVVMFVYRDDYYYPDQAEERGTKGKAEVIFAKQRKGATGTALLRFVPEFTRFVDESDREA
jgi:replicative DNA helicase